MRTTTSTSGTTGKARGAAVTTTLAALALALPLSGLFGGTAFAAATASPAASSGHVAPGQAKKADASAAAASSASSTAPSSNQNTTSTPYTNQGGITTGSNTTKYAVVNGRSGSPAVGGGQPSGNVYSPQPFSTADQNNTGANDTSANNPYRSTRNGAPSLNGNGGGRATGKPCAGCVGKADNKNPPGQAPNGTDHNAGYECDRNHGIGRSNPAHTGCVAGTTPPPVVTYCPGTTVPMTANGVCNSGSNGGGGQTTYCPGTTVPMPANGVCNSGSNGGGGQTTYCPGTTIPMPANGICNSGSNGGGGHTTYCPGTTSPVPPGGMKDCNATGTPTNGGNKNDKVTLCHATGSATNPFVVITVSKNGAIHGHAKHGDDIIPPFSYNDHGVMKFYPGQNWTAANQLSFANGCSTPATPVVCASGQTMLNGTCTPPVLCPAGSTMGANGSCTAPVPPVTPIVCASGQTMVNGTCQAPGTAPAPPVTCPAGAMVGPLVPGTARPGCDIQGGTGNGAQLPAGTPITAPDQQPGSAPGQQPGSAPVPTLIGQGSQPQPALRPVGAPAAAPAVVSARPTALPFTGGNAGLLAEGAALMLLLGGGLLLAARKKAAATV